MLERCHSACRPCDHAGLGTPTTRPCGVPFMKSLLQLVSVREGGGGELKDERSRALSVAPRLSGSGGSGGSGSRLRPKHSGTASQVPQFQGHAGQRLLFFLCLVHRL